MIFLKRYISFIYLREKTYDTIDIFTTYKLNNIIIYRLINDKYRDLYEGFRLFIADGKTFLYVHDWIDFGEQTFEYKIIKHRTNKFQLLYNVYYKVNETTQQTYKINIVHLIHKKLKIIQVIKPPTDRSSIDLSKYYNISDYKVKIYFEKRLDDIINDPLTKI
jgi:hypothetical protein